MTPTPDTSQGLPLERVFVKSVVIDAPQETVWETLTDLNLSKEWMFHSTIDITTDWSIGGPIIISGELHGAPFENWGRVLVFERPNVLEYTHLSSASRLADLPEHYARIRFELAAVSASVTRLMIRVSDAPTDVIHKHLAFYWNSTLEILKRQIEGRAPGRLAGGGN